MSNAKQTKPSMRDSGFSNGENRKQQSSEGQTSTKASKDFCKTGEGYLILCRSRKCLGGGWIRPGRIAGVSQVTKRAWSVPGNLKAWI